MRRMNPQPLCVYGLNRIFNWVKTIYGVNIWRDAGPSACGSPSRLVLLSDELCGPRRTRRRKATGATVGGTLVALGGMTEKSDWCYCRTNLVAQGGGTEKRLVLLSDELCGPRRTRRRKVPGATVGGTLVAHGDRTEKAPGATVERTLVAHSNRTEKAAGATVRRTLWPTAYKTEKSDWCYYRTNSGGPRKQDGEKRLALLSKELSDWKKWRKRVQGLRKVDWPGLANGVPGKWHSPD